MHVPPPGRNHVVLDRIEDVKEPPYCTHGKATCAACGHRVWLGSQTVGPVASRSVDPLCMACALKYARPENLIGRLVDHRRADGRSSGQS